MNLKIRTYDPKLTIKENAEANNVNELAIKRYIKRNGIDRQGDFDTYKEQGANLTMYAWFIWEKGYTGDTVLKWLYNVID